MVPKKIVVLGDGAWGTAIATVLAQNNHQVTLWCHNKEVAQQIENKRCNERYLPSATLSEKIMPEIELSQTLNQADIIFQAIPVKFLRSTLERVRHYADAKQIWVSLSKGIENETLLLPTQIITDVFDCEPQLVALAGPSFAKEVAEKQITAVVAASEHKGAAELIQELMATDYFCCYTSDDIVGVQLAAALKNVVTLVIGILSGAGYGDNTRAFIFTQAIGEIAQLLKAMGGQQKTMYGLAGIGDLVLTSMGSLSKNLQVGKRLGSGQNLEEILQETGFIPEGINTVASVAQLIKKHNLNVPICSGVYKIIFEHKTVDQFLNDITQNMPCG